MRLEADPPIAFARLWSRKECAVKLGRTTLDRLAGESFCIDGSIVDRHNGLYVLDRSSNRHAIVALSGVPLRGYPLQH